MRTPMSSSASEVGQTLSQGAIELFERFPNELLSSILEGVPGATIRANGEYTSLAPELNVSHVCRLWRQVAHSTTGLWTVFLHDGLRTPSISLERLKQSIRLSTNMAIEFGFKFLGLSEDGRRDQEEVLRLILPEIRRCRALHIVSEDNAGMDDFRDAVEEMETPVLESFTLSLDRCYERKGWGNFDDNIEISEWDASAFWEAPLTSLRMDGTGLRYLGPPLDCIRDLRLEGLYSSDLTKFLEPCFQQILALPNLEVLSIVNINFQYPRPDVESVPTLVEAKSLKHFRYRRHVRHDEIGCWFLTVVVAPLLETLTLDDFEVYGIPFRLSPTDRFPSLHTLTLHNPLSVTVLNPTLDETYPFRGFMSCTQHIKHLLVSVAHPGRHVLQRQSDPCRLIDSIFLAEIVRHAESSPFWGKLETISLDVTTRDIADNLQKLVAVFPHSTRDLKIPERHLATDAARSLNTPKTMKISKLGDFEAIVPAHPWSHWPTMERDPFGRRPLAERIAKCEHGGCDACI